MYTLEDYMAKVMWSLLALSVLVGLLVLLIVTSPIMNPSINAPGDYIHYSNGSEQYGSDEYLNAYRDVYSRDEETAYKLNPELYRFWTGYNSPEAHKQWLINNAH